MTIKLGVIMDPIANINVQHDSTFALLLEAQRRGWQLFYMELEDLFLRDGKASASMREIKVFDQFTDWYEWGNISIKDLQELDVILMRKDPPFNIEYIYSTYILEHAEKNGTLVINKPQSLRDANEKLFASWFPQCCPPTLVTRDNKLIKNFIAEHETIILKPLSSMGGGSVFKIKNSDPNINVTIETLSEKGHSYIMAQAFISGIKETGDKRIILINGEPVPYALARFPAADDFRGNIAARATAKGVELTARDHWLCEQISTTLKNKGLILVGLDVIGDFITEINVTSPTCIRELDRIFELNIAAKLMDWIAQKT